jgi:hypothetical protein
MLLLPPAACDSFMYCEQMHWKMYCDGSHCQMDDTRKAGQHECEHFNCYYPPQGGLLLFVHFLSTILPPHLVKASLYLFQAIFSYPFLLRPSSSFFLVAKWKLNVILQCLTCVYIYIYIEFNIAKE